MQRIGTGEGGVAGVQYLEAAAFAHLVSLKDFRCMAFSMRHTITLRLDAHYATLRSRRTAYTLELPHEPRITIDVEP